MFHFPKNTSHLANRNRRWTSILHQKMVLCFVSDALAGRPTKRSVPVPIPRASATPTATVVREPTRGGSQWKFLGKDVGDMLGTSPKKILVFRI